MSKRRFDKFNFKEDDQEFLPVDAADQAFWDEFWTQEFSRNEETPLVTITIKNEETGEEKVLENVRLRFKSLERLKDN